MNDLDAKIQAALMDATKPPVPIADPSLSEEILETFQGRHSFLMITTGIKMVVVGILVAFCAFQFFYQETTMAMIAYASVTIIAAVSAACMVLFLWVQMNHNTTVREIKRLELQVALLLQHISEKEDTQKDSE